MNGQNGILSPESFRQFWSDTYAMVTAMVPTYFIERELWSPVEGTRIYSIRVKNWDNTEFVLWLSRPENSRGGLLIGHDLEHVTEPVLRGNVTVCLPCLRGLGRSQCKEIPWQLEKYLLHGLHSKETYILRGAVTDLWMAAGVMIDMFPDTAENLSYSGRGLGALLGRLMLPWDRRFHSAELEGIMPELPDVPQVRKWFDPVAASQYLAIPVKKCNSFSKKT